MTAKPIIDAVGNQNSRRLFVADGGFLADPRVHKILTLAGWAVTDGKPGPDDWTGVCGNVPRSPDSEAGATQGSVLWVEESFLRLIRTGRDGAPPIGLNLDTRGAFYDSATPSDLEHLLATHALDDTAVLDRARHGIAWLRCAGLSKYNTFDPASPLPEAPYVLVIDQPRDDPSITGGGANAATFREMLVFAQTEHPGSRIVINSHPDTLSGQRDGHFGPEDASNRVQVLGDPVNPWALMEGATAVYTVSSQMGFEAIFAGHRPRVFGQPFYAGWGLTSDENPVPRRTRTLSRAQLFAAAMILYPVWCDPYHDRLCEMEQAIAALEVQAGAWRADHRGYIATGMRLWKRHPLQQVFGREAPVKFEKSITSAINRAAQQGGSVLAWASAAPEIPEQPAAPVLRIEDGFLRSRGLGADLIPPLSLVTDDLGIYYDPTRESRLERLIAASLSLPEGALIRAERLIRSLITSGVSKYNLAGAALPDLPVGQRILVPGQVEDDASIKKGCGRVRSNLALLELTRAKNPDAVILYKPHPDVEAGFRVGKLTPSEALAFADLIVNDTDPIALIDAADAVWTMTSLLGFEALLRGKPVTCAGVPFYAGWGLTQDLGDVPARRVARPSLPGLVHAALIDYPRYHDPVTNRPCPVEVAVDRLATGSIPHPGRFNRMLAKLQGLRASFTPFRR